ncbi:MAG: HesA/MoeB/ThiF family protein [Bacteroidota bacterium]|nr:HesA/MoeB/ThiF family protein [Bacteroidota bacterium]
MDNPISYERYQRQMILQDFGAAGQQKLLKGKVLLIGAGGLGCPALQYLAAAGVGTIGIIDDDVVALSNLHRQVLYSVNDIGLPKAERAAEKLRQLNPEIKIITYVQRLTNQNALSILEAYDLIIDGTDNFATRYMINDACILLNKPLIYGAISQYEGQVAIFNYRKSDNDEAVNYRDLFPDPPKEDEVLNCAEAGVLGVLPGIIGAMQANETIKLLTGIGKPLINRMLTFNALNNQAYEIELFSRPETRSLIPGNMDIFEATNYEWLCSSMTEQYEIDCKYFDILLASNTIDVMDIREVDEMPGIDEFPILRVPLKELSENVSLIQSDTVVIICQSGVRSLQAAKQLSAIFGESKKIFSLKGGIMEWKQQHTKQLL